MTISNLHQFWVDFGACRAPCCRDFLDQQGPATTRGGYSFFEGFLLIDHKSLAAKRTEEPNQQSSDVR
jgi:hypothetical protein